MITCDSCADGIHVDCLGDVCIPVCECECSNPPQPQYRNPDLEQSAKELLNRFEAAGFVTEVEPNQIYNLAEEVGEFIGAYRRWKGLARRHGSFDDVKHELADVVITAYVTATVLDIDLSEALSDKLSIIFTRDFRETV